MTGGDTHDTVLVTGVAGFIGAALAARLLDSGRPVYGIDNLSAYYDVALKRARLARLNHRPGFRFRRIDVTDRRRIAELFAGHRFKTVVHLAAQAGVRYSLENPYAYIDVNLAGFGNILEGCRNGGVAHLVFASSSSVYGTNARLPFSEHDGTDHPVSLYGATKKANELMAHTYAHLYGLPCTGLRFFTVYGPWGRPDMALFKFTRGILRGDPIPVFNRGHMIRDFTYIDDVVEGIARVLGRPPKGDPDWPQSPSRAAYPRPGRGDETVCNREVPDPATSQAPYRIYNIGNSRPVELLRYIEALERCLGKKARLDLLPMQKGDVPATHADVSDLEADVGYRPSTPIEVGVARFVQWYMDYYGIGSAREGTDAG